MEHFDTIKFVREKSQILKSYIVHTKTTEKHVLNTFK